MFLYHHQKIVVSPQYGAAQSSGGWIKTGFQNVGLTGSGQKYGGDGSGGILDWLHRTVYETDQYNPIALLWDGVEGYITGSDRFGNELSGVDSTYKIAAAVPIGRFAGVTGKAVKGVINQNFRKTLANQGQDLVKLNGGGGEFTYFKNSNKAN